MSRDVLARLALAEIPKLLTLQDRNPASPTYGCFDRNYWQYRIIDFPSGMAQEFAWPLALVWSLDLPDNPYRGDAALRDWIVAGLRFAARSAHADGSCDDYYPFERATGATAFSLLACLECYRVLDLDEPDLLRFFQRRAGWLAGHRESGRLSNHEALVIRCLERLGRLTGTDAWEGPLNDRLARLRSWQSEEGWFEEYGGCDPGYLTLTIGLLAELQRDRPDLDLRESLRSAIDCAAEFVHPDGSYGGEYGSRNTLNFFPHGFEIAGAWLPEAPAVNDRVLPALSAGWGPCYADDHIIGHHLWSWLLAWQADRADRPRPQPRAQGRQIYPRAGLVIDRRGDAELYAAINKGGVFKLFRGGRLVASDTGLCLQTGPKPRAAVSHLHGRYQHRFEEDGLVVYGRMGWAKQARLSPMKMIVLRCVMLTVGRAFPNAVRRLLQRLLVTGKSRAPFRFKRMIAWEQDGLKVYDEVRANRGWRAVKRAGIGGHQTSIAVVMSRVFEPSQLQPWQDISDRLKDLPADAPLTVERSL